MVIKFRFGKLFDSDMSVFYFLAMLYIDYKFRCLLNSTLDISRKLKLIKYSLSSPPETPPDSGIWGNNALISFRKAGHVVPTPFLVRVNCSVTIVAAQSLQLGEVPDNFHFYLALFLRSCRKFQVRCSFLIDKNLNTKLPFRTFWSNVTYSPDNPVNVLIESRSLHQYGTVSSNRIYKMHETTLIHVISTHYRI